MLFVFLIKPELNNYTPSQILSRFPTALVNAASYR